MKSLFYPEPGPMPYESVISVYLKISHCNFMSLSDLAKTFGSSKGNEESSRWRITSRVEDGLEKVFSGVACHLPWTYAPITALNNPAITLNFCPECIKFGYHSVFNWINLHAVCPLHKRSLDRACTACRVRFLRGFESSQAIPHQQGICDKCGFQQIGLRDELKMRRAQGLSPALDAFGAMQAKWYNRVGDLDGTGCGYAMLYYRSELARDDLTGPLERLFNELSPEQLSGNFIPSLPIACIGSSRTYFHDRIYANGSEFQLGDHMRLHSQRVIFEYLKERYLTHHSSCCHEMFSLADYPDGQQQTKVLCPQALAYALLCLKARYESWPAAGSFFQDIAATEYSVNRPPQISSGWSYRELTLMFLTILGRLECMACLGESFYLIARSGTVYFPDHPGMTILRKSSFKFRNNCKKSKINRLVISRSGPGGALMISCDATSSKESEATRLKHLVV